MVNTVSAASADHVTEIRESRDDYRQLLSKFDSLKALLDAEISKKAEVQASCKILQESLSMIEKDRDKFRKYVWNLFSTINSLNGHQINSAGLIHHLGLLFNATESWLTTETEPINAPK